jgi:hypothetical protein
LSREKVEAGVMKVFITLVVLCFLFGCAEEHDVVYPITTGFWAPPPPGARTKGLRFIVWSNHPLITNTITAWVQHGNTVVERARFKEILDEQHIRLTYTPDDDADILRVGRLLGADRIVFADATIREEQQQMSVGPSAPWYWEDYYGNLQSTPGMPGLSRAWTQYHVSVSVRAVNVETGEVRWSGTDHYPNAVTNLNTAIVNLTNSALARATCPIQRGYLWVERKGCERPGSSHADQ